MGDRRQCHLADVAARGVGGVGLGRAARTILAREVVVQLGGPVRHLDERDRAALVQAEGDLAGGGVQNLGEQVFRPAPVEAARVDDLALVAGRHEERANAVSFGDLKLAGPLGSLRQDGNL